MIKPDILDRISRGRTDLVFDLLRLSEWQAVLGEGRSDHGGRVGPFFIQLGRQILRRGRRLDKNRGIRFPIQRVGGDRRES